MRVIDEVDTERAEQVLRVEELQLGHLERFPHPPQIPDEAEVITADAWYPIAEVESERPRPHQCDRGKNRHRREVSAKRQQPSPLALGP
jgi:hypothetical protein